MPSIDPDITAVPTGGSPITFSTDLTGSLTWNVSWDGFLGGPNTGSGAGFPWTTPMTAMTVQLTVTNGTITLLREIVATADSFAYQPSSAVEGSVDDITLLHTMESGDRCGRRKTPPKGRWDLTFKNRPIAEYGAAVALFNTVGKTRPFTMADPATGDLMAWYFDSAVGRSYTGRNCDVSYSFKVVQA